jgi:peptidyl-prolyl cis-trans isomerase D
VKRSVALQNETREVATVLLPLSHFAAAVKAEPSAVKAYFEANKERFKTPDTVKLSYVSLKVENTAGAVDEASLKAYFETVKERYTEPEKRRARHILIQAGNDLEAARKKAEEVYGLATKPNADFAALAKQYSQDTGSAQQGGDLGLVEKSFFVGPFADAVFSMQVGEIKGPVKTPFGWHVIKLEQIEAGKAADFAKVKPELEKEYQKTEGERRFGERQEKLEQLAFESSGSLEPLAKALNLKIEEVPAFYEGLKDNELASNPKVLKAAFSADVLGGQNSRPIELAPGHVVVIRATDRKLPEVEPFEAVSSKVETLVKNEMAAKAAKAEAEKLAAAVSAGTALDVASKPLLATKAKEGEVKLAAARFIGRKDRTLAPDVIKAVFKAPAPTAGKPASGVVTLPNGDVEVYAVSVVKPGEVGNTASEAAEKAERVRGQGEFVTYLTTLRSKADVKFNPSVFE